MANCPGFFLSVDVLCPVISQFACCGVCCQFTIAIPCRLLHVSIPHPAS